MAQAGSIKAISGSVSAQTSTGQVRELNVGDMVYENELIVTSNGSRVTIELDNGKTINLSENAQVLIDESVTGVVDARDAVVSEVESLQAALEAGEEIGDEEATAAGEEDEAHDYDLAYLPGDQARGEVGSYLFGTEYALPEEVIPEETGEIEPEEIVEILPILTIDDQTVNEDAGTMTFTVTLSNPSSQDVTFDYASADVTALDGSDYTAVSGTGTITAGSTTTTITVDITDDDIAEPTETFQMNLTNPANATIADGQGIGTILDNDEPELPTLTIDDQTVNEDAGTMTFTVTLSNPSSQDVTFDYASADVTALDGSDYTAVSGTGTITAGSTTTTITVDITDDDIAEPTETFQMNLTNPANATIADGQGIGTILDNDAEPQVHIAVAEADVGGVTEGDTVNFVVTQDAISDSDTTVTVNL
ncbi:retention module-containing protein, partial [Desulfobacula sp.]|uniref:retention module-containing protein n=1 Tax=Desulfobacula sp. TaxID=2593537 RepID=UPI0025BEB7F0